VLRPVSVELRILNWAICVSQHQAFAARPGVLADLHHAFAAPYDTQRMRVFYLQSQIPAERPLVAQSGRSV